MFDPIGPGTPAWRAFDRALEAWYAFNVSGQRTRLNDGRINPTYRRYTNTRQYMIAFLKKNGADVTAWCKNLDVQKREYIPD